MKKDKQTIKCEVFECEHCDCDECCCTLDEINVCNCNSSDTKDSTMCDSFECKKA